MNETGFKQPIAFNNNNGAMIPFQKIRHAIQQLINEDVTSRTEIYPIHYLSGRAVNLQQARNINTFINFRAMWGVFKNRNKKRWLHVCVNNPDLTLTPNSAMSSVARSTLPMNNRVNASNMQNNINFNENNSDMVDVYDDDKVDENNSNAIEDSNASLNLVNFEIGINNESVEQNNDDNLNNNSNEEIIHLDDNNDLEIGVVNDANE